MENINVAELMMSEVVKQIRDTQPLNELTFFTVDDIYQTNGQIADMLDNIINMMGDIKMSDAKSEAFHSYVTYIFNN